MAFGAWRAINRPWFLILLQARSSFLFEHDDSCSTFSSQQPGIVYPWTGFTELLCAAYDSAMSLLPGV